jgi:hypothetical protein
MSGYICNLRVVQTIVFFFFGGGGESSCDGRMEVYVVPVIYCISRVGGKRSVSNLGHFTHRGIAPGTQCMVGWADPRATMEALGFTWI